jgi:N-acetylglucosamine-6-phosphate deacetylase
MDHAIANVMRIAQVSLEDAVAMATEHPARLCGIPEGGSTRFELAGGRLRVLETRLEG